MSNAPLHPIEILVPGTFTSMEGTKVTFGENDLAEIAASYDVDANPAPLVVGHPKANDPAYGWAGRVYVDGGKLYADADHVEPSFAEAVRDKRYRRISPQLYPKDHPSNPTPGRFYLKHIGFLGAAAPAIRGIRPVSFEEADGTGCLTFSSDTDLNTQSNLTVETEMPNPQADIKDDKPQTVKVAGKEMSFAEAQAHFDERAKNADAREKAMDDAGADRRHKANVSFAEGLVANAKIAGPAKDKVIFLLDSFGSVSTELSFGEGDAAQSPDAIFREMLSAAKPLVSFGEFAKPEAGGDAKETYSFAAPPGMEIDPDQGALYAKAKEYQASHPDVGIVDAVRMVRGKG